MLLEIKPKQILFIQAVLLITIGLVDLFSLGLPPIEKFSMFAVFPLIFPIVLGAIFLFVLPLLNEGAGVWVWMVLLLTILTFLVAAIFVFTEPKRRIAMLIISFLNLISGFSYLVFIKKNTK